VPVQKQGLSIAPLVIEKLMSSRCTQWEKFIENAPIFLYLVCLTLPSSHTLALTYGYEAILGV